MQVRKPDAPISAKAPMPLKKAPEHRPIADSSRLTATWRKRASPPYCVISRVIQPSGKLATSEMPHSALTSTMCSATLSAAPAIRPLFGNAADLSKGFFLESQIGPGLDRNALCAALGREPGDHLQRIVEVEERALDAVVDEREAPLARPADRDPAHRSARNALAVERRKHQVLRERAGPRDRERLASQILERLDLGLHHDQVREML